VISIGDRFSVTEQRFEEIPYAVSDRIRWFLKKGDLSAAIDLAHTIGLPASYAFVAQQIQPKQKDKEEPECQSNYKFFGTISRFHG